MGTTLYIALDQESVAIELNNDRVFLADLVSDHEAMAKLCHTLGVRSLSEFQSYDPELIGSFVEDKEARKLAIAKARPIEWFNPSDALSTIPALISHYETNRFIQERGQGRKVGGKIEWQPLDRTADLIRELKDLEDVLSYAADHGVRFRLYIGF